jgi:hypothetical protein
MKQHITVEQYRELTQEQQNNLLSELKLAVKDMVSENGFDYEGYVTRCTTIGKMIEILSKNLYGEIMIYENEVIVVGPGGSDTLNKNQHEELCDALWEAVKTIL